MLMEALEILQSAESDQDTFVTDFGLYKIVFILTVYIPFGIATFLLSQEYLGEKIACFPPENFTDAQGEAVQEYCWNEGYWVSHDTIKEKMLYTQPHRYYPLYLPIQALLFTTPIIFWNIMTKSRILAALRGTEEFLEELLELIQGGDEDDEPKVAKKAKQLLRQYHHTCVACAQGSSISFAVIIRMTWEFFLIILIIFLQFQIYNFETKHYHCSLPELSHEEIMCTVPVLDLLDGVWSINVAALILALCMNLYMWRAVYRMYILDWQPMFFNKLPYGADDDFNENVEWENNWVKNSYRLLLEIFKENNCIMTKTYVLMAMRDVPTSRDETENQSDVSGSDVMETTEVESIPSIPNSPSEEATIMLGTDTANDATERINQSSPRSLHYSPIKVDLTSKHADESLRRRRIVVQLANKSPIEIKPNIQDYTMLSLILFVGFLFCSLL